MRVTDEQEGNRKQVFSGYYDDDEANNEPRQILKGEGDASLMSGKQSSSGQSSESSFELKMPEEAVKTPKGMHRRQQSLRRDSDGHRGSVEILSSVATTKQGNRSTNASNQVWAHVELTSSAVPAWQNALAGTNTKGVAQDKNQQEALLGTLPPIDSFKKHLAPRPQRP